MKFIIFSRRLIEQAKPYDKPHIIISVRTPGDPDDAKLPVGDQTLACLRLQFHEEYDDYDGAAKRHDYHLKHGNAFTVETGRYVLSFVEQYADRIEAVILHCDAGLARSPSIAHALSETIFLGEENKFFGINKHDQGELSEKDVTHGGRLPTCSKYIMEAFGGGGIGFSTGEMSSGELELKLDIRGTTGSVYLSKEMWQRWERRLVGFMTSTLS